MKVGAFKYGLNTLPMTMTFGYLLNATRRLARRGMLLGTKPNRDSRRAHTHTYV